MDSRAGMTSPFSKRAAEAIRKAKDDMDVGDIDPGVRGVIIEKIYQSIAYSQPWEHMGETGPSDAVLRRSRTRPTPVRSSLRRKILPVLR